jgi:membrane protein
VIILLTWFYISGFMLLFGAEVNSEIEAATAQNRLAGHSALALAVKPGARAGICSSLPMP